MGCLGATNGMPTKTVCWKERTASLSSAGVCRRHPNHLLPFTSKGEVEGEGVAETEADMEDHEVPTHLVRAEGLAVTGVLAVTAADSDVIADLEVTEEVTEELVVVIEDLVVTEEEAVIEDLAATGEEAVIEDSVVTGEAAAAAADLATDHLAETADPAAAAAIGRGEHSA